MSASGEPEDEKGAALQFVAQAAHDLRNPLAVITGTAELLDARWDSLRDDQRKEFVVELARHGRAMRHLTDSLLDWTALESGKIPVHLHAVGLREMAEEATANLEFPVELTVPDTPVQADSQLLWRVLKNLLINAIKYGRPPLELRAQVAESEAVIRVIDHGPGLPESVENRLFEPFVRGGSVTEGAGLGLAIVRRLVEVQGGRVWYEHNGHACFAVALPLTA